MRHDQALAYRSELDDTAKALDDPASTSVLEGVRMRRLGVPYSKIAGILRIFHDNVTNNLKLYRDKDFGALVGTRHRPASSVDSFLEEIASSFAEEEKDGERRFFFVDAAPFVTGAFPGMVWVFARVFVRTEIKRQQYSVLSVVEYRDHDFISVRTTGSVIAETICELIAKIDESYPREEVTLVRDNAGYLRSQKVAKIVESVGIEMRYLPANSPNLKLIERVWRLVKGGYLRNRCHETFKQFKGAIDGFLDSEA